MLTLAKVATGAQAASYYQETDDYYTGDRSPSTWWGDGAARLGLCGAVEAGTFRDLLDGKMPDGTLIHNAASGRRGGTDFTFSAPKSVSMQAMIGGDARLIDAHEKAVTEALAYVETVLAGYRITADGETGRQASGNLLVARFRHDLSREADPQLHSHCVVINATQRPDGAWRALEQAEFYRQQKLMGALYRNVLALEVQALGYGVRLTHGDGRFELAHLAAHEIEAFSTRSRDIEAALVKAGKTRETASAKQKEFATITTRDQKTVIDRSQLRESWHDKSRTLGIDYRPSLAVAAPDLAARTRSAVLAVTFAVEHATERQAVVTEAELLRAGLERGTSKTDWAALRAHVEDRVQAGELIRAGSAYTTPVAQARERELLALEVRGRGAMRPIMEIAEVDRHLAGTALNAGQRAAAALVVTTGARVVAIQGAAGTGKTTMLAEAVRLAATQGYRVNGLAPSGAAARELAAAGIDSETVAAFRARDGAELTDKTLIVLDEAGMVSAKDMHALLLRAEAAGARVVLVGDVQQLKAVEAGRPFAQLQANGMDCVRMGEIQRQVNLDLKQAVIWAAEGKVRQSVAVLDANVIEIDTSEARHARIAADYAALAASERDETLIVAGTHGARNAINAAVRERLELAGTGIVVTALDRKDLTTVQARSSLHYQPGDVVEATRRYPSLGLARGERATVVEAGRGQVTLVRTDGGEITWRPALLPNMVAYHAAPREFAVGDRVRFTANDHVSGIANGDAGRVRSIDGAQMLIETADGTLTRVDAARPVHLDHGYCSTVHAAQGRTCTRVLIEADTGSATANESSYYVAISRARESATLYTDDRELLPAALARPDAKSAALDLQPGPEAAMLER